MLMLCNYGHEGIILIQECHEDVTVVATFVDEYQLPIKYNLLVINFVCSFSLSSS